MYPFTIRWTDADLTLLDRLHEALAAELGVPHVRRADLIRMGLHALAARLAAAERKSRKSGKTT